MYEDSKEYRDEPILVTAAEAAAFLPPKYREMRRLAFGPHYVSDERTFCEQGRFMADFEDDFDYRGEFVRYFPTYQSMNDRQLRGYFSWRTGVRRGAVRRTELAFAFVYIYELLNLIGVNSPREGLRALKKFWAAYGPLDARIDPYLRLWVKDFIVYHNLDRVLLTDFLDAETDADRATMTLLDHKARSADEVFEALRFFSSYDLGRSRFFKKHADDVKAVSCAVWGELFEYYSQRPQQAAREKFFGKLQGSAYTMFKSAVFDRGLAPPYTEDFTYRISDIHRYRWREDGSWSCERFFSYKGRSQQIGALLKAVDFLMRERYGFKSTMKAQRAPKRFQDCIRREIEKFLALLASERQKSLPKIDLSKLPDIRHAALETQSKLIVEEEDILDEPQTTSEEATPAEQETGALLSDVQRRFLGRLLHGEPYDDLLRPLGLMLSILADGINESLWGRFGDTVIVCDDDKPELIEDYIGELKGIIGE